MLTDDLCKLKDLTDENIIMCLQSRYSSKNIYTHSGIVLISINPYSKLQIYGNHVMQAYFNTSTVDPHIYSIAENVYQDMLLDEDQTIIISGESGSGKTENTKFIIDYLIYRTNTQSDLRQRIEAANLIMENFGNARTTLNENSSRFGKKITFFFKESIAGARVDTYLLEKSRVTHQSKNESNFHIFYQLCASKDIEINNDFLNTEDVLFKRCEESLKDAMFFEEKFGDCNIKFNNSIAKQHTDFHRAKT